MLSTDVYSSNYPQLDIEFINTEPYPVTVGWTLTSNRKPFSIGPSSTLSHEKRLLNRKILSSALETDEELMVYVDQVHGDDIVILDPNFTRGSNIDSVDVGDAIISKIPGSQLNLSLADCAGILIYHPPTMTIAAVHSGWKGTKYSITEKTIKSFARLNDIRVAKLVGDLIIWFTPSASSEKYEVGEEFREYFPKSTYKKNHKLFYNNRQEIRNRLLLLGCKTENIIEAPGCSITETKYHSYRRDHNESGRMNAFIRLDKKAKLIV